MKKQQIEEKILRIAGMVFKVYLEDISMELNRQNVKSWDSFTHLCLISQIEAEFAIDIPMDEVTKICKISDFLKYIKE
jgi:acyl carrier protein